MIQHRAGDRRPLAWPADDRRRESSRPARASPAGRRPRSARRPPGAARHRRPRPPPCRPASVCPSWQVSPFKTPAIGVRIVSCASWALAVATAAWAASMRVLASAMASAAAEHQHVVLGLGRLRLQRGLAQGRLGIVHGGFGDFTALPERPQVVYTWRVVFSTATCGSFDRQLGTVLLFASAAATPALEGGLRESPPTSFSFRFLPARVPSSFTMAVPASTGSPGCLRRWITRPSAAAVRRANRCGIASQRPSPVTLSAIDRFSAGLTRTRTSGFVLLAPPSRQQPGHRDDNRAGKPEREARKPFTPFPRPSIDPARRLR